jgi:hypothetical protein
MCTRASRTSAKRTHAFVYSPDASGPGAAFAQYLAGVLVAPGLHQGLAQLLLMLAQSYVAHGHVITSESARTGSSQGWQLAEYANPLDPAHNFVQLADPNRALTNPLAAYRVTRA